jgi:uncharacterized repeat protein (TIGR01451 family)
MPLGDSITEGSSSGVDDPTKQVAYRRHLWHDLDAAGYDVDFVGSLTNGEYYQPLEGFDPDHEGHGGKRDDEVAANVYNWLTSNPAQVVLLHIGTNGLNTSPNDVESILNEVDRYDESVTVVLARIINRQNYSQTTTDFNDNVEAMALNRIAKGDKIILVDMENGAGIDYSQYPPGDMWDNLHPYATGYIKMADLWLAALDDFLSVCYSAPSITSTPVTETYIGEPYSYEVNATGSPPPTYTLSITPTGMTISETAGLISWTPTAGQVGPNAVEVEARNSEGTDTQAFTITVTAPTTPVITSTPVTETVINQLYTYDVEASGDPPPTYTLTISPSGMSINETTGLIQWTPSGTGTFSTTVAASNLADVVTQSFSINVVDPAIAVTKSPASQTIVEDGTAVFTITVSNTGDTSLDNIQVSDLFSPDCDNTIGTLTASDSTSYTCSQANVTADFTNTITATGTYTPTSGSPVTVSDADSASVNTVMPAIAITKSPAAQTVVSGGTAVFTITVTNTGESTLNSVQIDDSLSPDCDNTIGTLTASDSTSYTCSQANVTADFTNTITTTGTYTPTSGSPVTVSDTDSAFVDVLPTISLKQSSEGTVQPKPGGLFTFTLTVTNTSNEAVVLTSLTSASLSDLTDPGNPALASTTCNTGTNVAVGGVYTCSFTTEVLGQPGDYTISATATAEDDEGNEASDSDDTVVTITEPMTFLYLPLIFNN